MKEEILLNSDGIDKIIRESSEKIYKDFEDINEFAIVGIQTRGVELANRIKKNIEGLCGRTIKSGILDISFYRDDLATRGVLPVIKETRIEFNITKKKILMVDDVIFTGRTVKAALDALTSFGRPRAIKLFTLIDRGNREFPIQPDYCGFHVKTDVKDNIMLLLKEIDNVEDTVILESAVD